LQKAVTPALVAEMRQAGNEGDGRLARAFHRKMFERGWWAIGWPKEFGGLGKSAVEQYIFIDEMMAAGAPAMRLAVSSVAPTILRVGSEEQKARWLPPILKGEIDFAVAYSEPDAGTDLASLKTRAVLDGDQWVVNGQKIWNTGAHTASHNWVAVRTEPEAPKHKGISMMIVPMDRAGITVQPLWTWSGIRTNAVFFEDVRVPRDHLVGERGMGFYYAMMALDFERIMIGSVGMIRRMLDELIGFVRRTPRSAWRSSGSPASSRPTTRRRRSPAASSGSTPPRRCSASVAAPTRSSAPSSRSAGSACRGSRDAARADGRAGGDPAGGAPLPGRRDHARAAPGVGPHRRGARPGLLGGGRAPRLVRLRAARRLRGARRV